MERLGLWGDGTPFKSFETFLEGITKRGLGNWSFNFYPCRGQPSRTHAGSVYKVRKTAKLYY